MIVLRADLLIAEIEEQRAASSPAGREFFALREPARATGDAEQRSPHIPRRSLDRSKLGAVFEEVAAGESLSAAARLYGLRPRAVYMAVYRDPELRAVLDRAYTVSARRLGRHKGGGLKDRPSDDND